MSNKLPYTHLLYVRQYSIIDNDDELVIFGVNTKDIFHTMGELMYRNPVAVKRINCVKCTQKVLNFWLKNGFKVHNFKDKYTDVKV